MIGRFVRAVGLVVVIALVVVYLEGRGSAYHYRVPLENASGLKDGGAVRIGGEDQGHLNLLLTKSDDVVAKLSLDKPLGKDATVQVIAANFLGTKRIVIDPGNAAGDRAPENYMIPADRVTLPTDLDQVLGVFDNDTRTRMRILLNEAGAAVMGRQVDIQTLFRDFPIGLEDAGAIVNDVKTDNATMRSLLQRSDRFVAEATAQRKELGHMIDVFGATAATVNARRTELQQTLARAPHTLQTLRTFSQDLLDTTRDLGPAAQEIARTAPPLNAALAKVPGLREAAEPTLDTAVDVAPKLSQLATGATPVLRGAEPTVRKLAVFGEALPPVTDALDKSFDNLTAILQNWSRAIQFRDGLSHVFRGSFGYSPDALLSAIDRLTPSTRATRKHTTTPAKAKPVAGVPTGSHDGGSGGGGGPAATLPGLQDLLEQLPTKGLTNQLDNTVGGTQQSVTGLLDYLLKP